METKSTLIRPLVLKKIKEAFPHHRIKHSWIMNTVPRRKIQKGEQMALAGVAQWIEHRPANQRVVGSIPSQGTCLRLWARSPVGGM